MKTCKTPNCKNPRFSGGLCRFHWGVNQVKTKKVISKKAAKKLSVAKLKKELDVIFSPYIRMKAADSNGNAVCVTCGREDHWTKLQNGHFLPRSVAPSLVFAELNCNPQCMRCNVFLNGNYIEYTLWFQKVHGTEVLQMLMTKKQFPWKPTAFEMEILIKEYIQKFLAQCKRLNHEPSVKEQKVIDKYTK